MQRAKIGTITTELVASLAVAFTSIGMTISLAALIFSGPLASGLPRAVSSFVLGSALVMGIIGWKSRIRPVIGIVQDGPAVVVVSVAATMSVRPEVADAVDVLVLIGGITLLSGLAMILLSRVGFRMIARSLPATLVSSFLAGTGWLLCKGGVEVMVRRNLGLDDVASLFKPDLILYWMPGIILGFGMYLAGKSDRISSLAVSGLVVGGVVVFFVVTAVGSSLEAVELDGWLIGPFPNATDPALIVPAEVKAFGLTSAFRDGASALSVVVIATMVLVLNLSGLERLDGRSVDFDHELRIAGLANLVVAPLGCLVGFHAVGRSALARQMGAKGRVVPVCASICCLGFGLAGGGIVGYTPRLVAGGLLIAVGLGLFHNWATELAMPGLRLDRVLSVLIVLSIALFGILEGVILGAVGICVIFVIRYSRIDPIRSVSTGDDIRSRVDRTNEQRKWIDQRGSDLTVFELQGYLFFGSVAMLADSVRNHLAQTETSVPFVVLDLRYVTGVDSSGFTMLSALVGEVVDRGGSLLISDPPRNVNFSKFETEPKPCLVPTLDDALERFEELRLSTFGGMRSSKPVGSASMKTSEFGLSSALLRHMTRTRLTASEVLLHQGARSDVMHIVLCGSLVVNHVEQDGSRRRLRRASRGAVLGEIGVLTGGDRSAEVIAASDVEVLVLTADRYDRLRSRHPALALEFHDFLLTGMAERSVSMSDSLNEALR